MELTLVADVTILRCDYRSLHPVALEWKPLVRLQVVATALSLVGRPVSMDKVIYLSERMFYQEGTMNAGYLDQCAKLRSELGGMTQVTTW